MPPLLKSFLMNLLTETDCKHQTLVLDQAITPDFNLLETAQQAERERDHHTEANCIHRYLYRHHSQPSLRSDPWSSTSIRNSPRGFSRWDSGSSSSQCSQCVGQHSDLQLVVPLRTCDDRTNNSPTTHADRWSVSRYHSDSLVSPPRSKETISLATTTQSNNDQLSEKVTSIKRTKIALTQSVDMESPPEMVMRRRRSLPLEKQRSSLRKKRPSTTVHEMEIIWERQNTSVEKPQGKTQDGGMTATTTTMDDSCKNQATTTTSRPYLSWLICTEKSTFELLTAALLLVGNSFSPEVIVKPSADDIHINFDSCIRTFTIFDLCGGDIAPACRQLECNTSNIT
jgi:hypothetical protein